MMEEWSAGGRFLAKDYLDLDYFPCALIAAFIVCVIFEKTLEYEKVFLQSFQSCITKDEEDAVDELLFSLLTSWLTYLTGLTAGKSWQKKSLRAYSRSDSWRNNREVPGTWLMMLHYKDELTTAERL